MSSKRDTNEAEIISKTKLRTATDVISRLMWDESLPKEDFIVGYLDRFKGVLEQRFTSLDWRDPAIVDNCSLALPKHRIQYFKYKNRKVWDKNLRLDVIFSSVVNGQSIHDFIKHIDEEENKFYEEDFDVTKEEDPENVDQKEYNNSDRPNFFVAVRMTDDDLIQNLSEVTEHVKIVESDLDECCIKDSEFHMTLATLRLDTAEDITKAVEAMNKIRQEKFSVPTITLKSMDMFQYRVAYACVKHDGSLIKLRDALVQSFTSRKIQITDKFNFVPHVTIVKLSRPVARSKHTKFLDQNLFTSFENKEFGSQVLKTLCLSEMGGSRQADGFYKCAAEIEL